MKILLFQLIALAAAMLAFVRAWLDRRAYQKQIDLFSERVREAERILRQRAELASEVAHEIKNPITAILCSAETLDLLIGPGLDDAHRQSLRYIREYGDTLLRLVSDFLDVSRAEGGQLHARPEAVKVMPIVQSIIGLLESNAMRKKITVTCVATVPDLTARIDPKHLKQIVFNLLHNAIKFSQEGGKVQVLLSRSFPQPFVRIEVTDNGCGVESAQLPHIFEPYVHSADGAARDLGTGLGLTLAKALVELSGGKITAESQVNVGSSFVFTIPEFDTAAHAETAAPASQSTTVSEPALRGQRFLVVDEDSGARESVARLIEAWGGMVDRVELAADAVRALATSDYDAVVLDETRDGISAAELARTIRKELDDQQTTIIIASRDHLEADEVAACGANRYLEKPLSGKTMLASLVKSGRYSITH